MATLRRAGVEPEVIASGVDESSAQAGSPAELVGLLARRKAQAVAETLTGAALVLGCDSLLELDGEAVGKPGSSDAAAARWRRMRGRSGTLHTGHCVIDVAAQRTRTRSVATLVRFADITDAEVEMYCRSGEPTTVAGAFTIDGLGGWFVEGIDGDPHNVVGLSLPTLRHMLRELSYGLSDLGFPPLHGQPFQPPIR